MDRLKDTRNSGCTYYEIKIRGRLDEDWSGWLNGITISFQGNVTTLSGCLDDQVKLRGVLSRLWDLNLEIISVEQTSSSSKVLDADPSA